MATVVTRVFFIVELSCEYKLINMLKLLYTFYIPNQYCISCFSGIRMRYDHVECHIFESGAKLTCYTGFARDNSLLLFFQILVTYYNDIILFYKILFCLIFCV